MTDTGLFVSELPKFDCVSPSGGGKAGGLPGGGNRFAVRVLWVGPRR
jgi:hypothetical protein